MPPPLNKAPAPESRVTSGAEPLLARSLGFQLLAVASLATHHAKGDFFASSAVARTKQHNLQEDSDGLHPAIQIP